MKKTGVSFGLAALLAMSCLVSCITKDYTLGSGLVPAIQDISVRTTTFDLPVGLKMADSLQTSISQKGTVGAIRTDRYGLYRSDAAMAVTAAYDSISWGKNPSVTSVRLVLTRDTTLVVDPGERYIPQNLYVHRLKVVLDSTTIFNNSLTENDYDHEVLSLGGLVYTGDDTYSVELDKKLGEELLKIPTATLDSAELFMKAFKGLYIRCDEPLEDCEGGRLTTFDLSASYINFTYQYDDDNGNRRSKSENFLVGEEYAVNICTAGSRPLEEPLAADALYMEGNCGIKPHISAKELRGVLERFAAENQLDLERVLIAKAVLKFPFEYTGDYKQFDYYATNLYPCKRTKNASGSRIYTTLDEIEEEDLESGYIDRSNLCYTVNVSMYLQNLISRKASDITTNDDLWIMPTITLYSSTTGVTFYYPDYYYYSQSRLNGTSDARHPVLQLTYSVLL
ncbi:MAG: DUF4270 family protein [Bacteroidales bacterium]|nr:DUF4270 family protein [Bacteroidales bacterium]